MCHLRVSPQMFVTVENFSPVCLPLPYTPEWYPCHLDTEARLCGAFPSSRAMRITRFTGGGRQRRLLRRRACSREGNSQGRHTRKINAISTGAPP